MLNLKDVTADGMKRMRDALDQMARERIIERIWSLDHTVWSDDPAEISNRLGWLTSPADMRDRLDEIKSLVGHVRADGFTHAVLLGMGGSSLAPEVFAHILGTQPGYLTLSVLDSTDPAAVKACENFLDLSKTLFIVSTKSGGTVETLSGFKYFYNRVSASMGQSSPGEHFIAITDPGSSLVDLAARYQFRATFLNDPNIGGRYSALSFFGLVPAGLLGLDLRDLLARAGEGVVACRPHVSLDQNPGAMLGALIGEMAMAGRDKLTLIASPAFESFGDWVEQLIAESTGKMGNGILPVVGERVGPPSVYGADRLFVYLRLNGDSTNDALIEALARAGHPVVRVELKDRNDLSSQFFIWEMATAVAGYRLGIQPFDQPNVEAAKVLARQMVAAYLEKGTLPVQTPTLTDGEIAVYGEVSGGSASAAFLNFLGQAGVGAYVSLQAYVPSTGETTTALQSLQTAIRDRTRLATTAGYGPRFLHSTGQLHKGDAGKGLFIQFTHDHAGDIGIPDEAGKDDSTMPFGVLIDSQALGDAQALRDAGRKVIRFHLGKEVNGGLRRLIEALN